MKSNVGSRELQLSRTIDTIVVIIECYSRQIWRLFGPPLVNTANLAMSGATRIKNIKRF